MLSILSPFLYFTTEPVIASAVYVAGNVAQKADLIVLCSGADFETLYPDRFASLPITKCKLQMMRLVPQPNDWRIGPPLCSGLSRGNRPNAFLRESPNRLPTVVKPIMTPRALPSRPHCRQYIPKTSAPGDCPKRKEL